MRRATWMLLSVLAALISSPAELAREAESVPCREACTSDYDDYVPVCEHEGEPTCSYAAEHSCVLYGSSQLAGWRAPFADMVLQMTGPRCRYAGGTPYVCFPASGVTLLVRCAAMSCLDAVLVVGGVTIWDVIAQCGDPDQLCLSASGINVASLHGDYDCDGDIDLADYAELQRQVAAP